MRTFFTVACLTLQLFVNTTVADNELGVGAGFSVMYLRQYPGTQFYISPVTAYFDHSFTSVIGLRIEAGWSQFSEKDDEINEGSIDPNGKLTLSDKTITNRNQLHKISLRPSLKIVTPTAPVRGYGTLGIGLDLPIAARQTLYGHTDLWTIGDNSGFFPGIQFPLIVSGGADYLFSSWRIGVQLSIQTVLGRLFENYPDTSSGGLPRKYNTDPMKFLRLPVFSFRLNVAFAGFRKRGG